jgi:hypothetical protein
MKCGNCNKKIVSKSYLVVLGFEPFEVYRRVCEECYEQKKEIEK